MFKGYKAMEADLSADPFFLLAVQKQSINPIRSIHDLISLIGFTVFAYCTNQTHKNKKIWGFWFLGSNGR